MYTKINTKSELLFLTSIITAIFLFYCLTLTTGHNWFGDFSLYVMHALNLANGIPYSETGYIVNPLNPWLSPPTYPPVFPILLAPLVKVVGANLYVIKFYLICIFCLTLVVFYRVLRDKIDQPASRLLVILFTGFSPWFFDIKEIILSEFTFILFIYLFLMVADSYIKANSLTIKKQITYGVVIGLLAYLAYGCRSIGITLMPIFILAALIYNRKITLGMIIALAVFAGFYGLQYIFLNTDASYLAMLSSDDLATITNDTDLSKTNLARTSLFGNITFNLMFYIKILSGHWFNNFSVILRMAVFAITTILAVIGYLTCVKKKNVSEVFAVCYFGALLMVPFLQENRYLLPIIPLYLMYIFKGIESGLLQKVKINIKHGIAILTTLFIVTYAGAYTEKTFTEKQAGLGHVTFKQVTNFISQNTREDAVFVFIKPRILALHTDRHAFAYNADIPADKAWNNIRQLKADYMLTVHDSGDGDRNFALVDFKNYRDLINDQRDNITLIYSNANFDLYKIIK